MTDNTVVSVTAENTNYKNPIAVRFFAMYENYTSTGKIFTPKDILGEPPIIPDSPDSDARLEAFEEHSKYFEKYKEMENLINAIQKKEL